MGKNITDIMFVAVQPLLQKIYQHPFITRLSEGTLPREQFVFYLQQDSLYLVEYARALALVAAKSPGESDIALGLGFAQEALLAERELHNQYFSEYGVMPVAEKMPGCLMYTSYLLSCAVLEPVGVGMAALLPCFWIYNEVGKRILAMRSKGNPYDSWIDLYAGEEFAEGVRQAVAYTNRLGNAAGETERQRMVEAFMQAGVLEYHFWDDAGNLRTWSV